MGLVHHDLCFGCGIANLFGLQLELDAAAGGVSGRFFVKQDHQGPRGTAHEGIVAAALAEAMALAVHAEGIDARAGRFEVELDAPAPIGAFVHVEARVDRRSGGGGIEASATATDEDGRRLGGASAAFVPDDRASV